MSRTPTKVSIGIVAFARPVPRRGSIEALSGFGSGPQIGAEMHQRVQARRRRENPRQRAQRGLEVGVQRKGAAAGLPLPGAVGSMEHLRPLPCPVASVTMAQVSEAIALARRPAFIENRHRTRFRARARVVAREPSMARSWVGRTIFACWPCMAMRRLREARHSYMNCANTEECYECAVVSRKMVEQIRSSPTLRHKVYFAVQGHSHYASAMRGQFSHCIAHQSA
jgi:hypothetical protein